MLDALLVFLHDIARWFLTLYARWWEQLKPSAKKPREWFRVDDDWPTTDAVQIAIFVFKVHLADAGHWLPLIASWTPARDAWEAQMEMAKLERDGDFDAFCVLPFWVGDEIRYLLRCDVDDASLTDILEDLEVGTCSRTLDMMVRPHPLRLRRLSDTRFGVGCDVVEEGDDIEVEQGGEWHPGRLRVVKGRPFLNGLLEMKPILARQAVRIVPRPSVTPEVTPAEEPVAPPPKVVHVFGIIQRVSRDTTYDTLHGARLYSGDRIEVRLPGGMIIPGRYWWNHDRERAAYLDADTRRIPLSQATPVRRCDPPRG